MAKKNKRNFDGMVYSTDPGFSFEPDHLEDAETLPANQQDLRVWKEMRNGKPTTVVKGFIGAEQDLKELGKELRRKCSCGGSDKDGEIILQGDVRDKVMALLTSTGYKCKKAGG